LGFFKKYFLETPEDILPKYILAAALHHHESGDIFFWKIPPITQTNWWIFCMLADS
jgi:hypothetical protein